MRVRHRFELVGIVQGVGFRPFVYRLAQRYRLAGYVRNHSRGVTIEVEGPPDALEQFAQALQRERPPAAVIDAVDRRSVDVQHASNFVIVASDADSQQSTPVSPDLATCDDCLREFSDPSDRRFRYPFINCTNCGPRYTIVRDIPYDRPQTTMSGFTMCAECRREYDDPGDRRFHAQPNACPRCGPQVWWVDREAPVEAFLKRPASGCVGKAALAEFARAIRQGRIVAVKGIGGFHLACSATNDDAIKRLRRRKNRGDKPLAVMVRDLETVEQFALVDEEERTLLLSPERPIVLLRKARPNQAHVQRDEGRSFQEPLTTADSSNEPSFRMSEYVAPGNDYVGVMLPYSALHTLLVADGPLVMTSGNVSEEPIVRTNREARERLGKLADAFLLHDREIHVVCDDSVVRTFRGAAYPVRRSRGYAPMPIRLRRSVPSVLAVGGELKATFCLTRENYAYVSPHIGDLGNWETLEALGRTVDHFERLFRCRPERIACDLHPSYLSSLWAREQAKARGIPLIEVQHHHAHIASVLLERGQESSEPVIGISFDGTGYGSDGAIWGGEVLVATESAFRRWGHLRYIPLPGGDAAIRHPCRVALAHLYQAGLEWDSRLPSVGACAPELQRVLRRQLDRQLRCVPTSSMGRLFDAVASLAGVRHTIAYEAQAAMELEALAEDADTATPYPFEITGDVPRRIDPTLMLEAICADVFRNRDPSVISSRFHATVASMITECCRRVRQEERLDTVVLSGGVFQNVRLLHLVVTRLEQDRFRVLWPTRLPANDGGLALGQIAVAIAEGDAAE